MEVGYHHVGDGEVVRRVDELVCPAVVGAELAGNGHGALEGAHCGGTDGTDVLAVGFCCLDGIHDIVAQVHLLGVGAMFREVFDLDILEFAPTAMDSQLFPADIFDFHTFQQLAAEVQACNRGGHRAFNLGIDGLVVLGVAFLDVAQAAQLVGQRCAAHALHKVDELLVAAVEEEADGAAARGGVVHHFGYQGVVGAEIELVAYADLAGGIHQHVPKAHLGVQFANQKHLDAGAGFLLLAVEQGGEHSGVVGHHHVAGVDIVDEFFEDMVLDLAGFTVDHHHAGLVAVADGLLGDKFFGQVESELR